MAENNISNIMNVTMEKIRALVDSGTIVGDPITVNEVTIIPISKVSFGLASGGSDFPSKQQADILFGGGGGAGASVSPVGFLVIKGNDVKMLSINDTGSPIEKVVTAVPEIVSMVSDLFPKKGSEGKEKNN
jgi:sporulation protein YtfJ